MGVAPSHILEEIHLFVNLSYKHLTKKVEEEE